MLTDSNDTPRVRHAACESMLLHPPTFPSSMPYRAATHGTAGAGGGVDADDATARYPAVTRSSTRRRGEGRRSRANRRSPSAWCREPGEGWTGAIEPAEAASQAVRSVARL